MKSSKMEYNFPPVEEARTLSPFTYYQPFQSSFDPEFSIRQRQPQDRWGQGTAAGLRTSGGEAIGPPRLTASSLGCFSGPSAFPWREAVGRSLCNSTWLGPPPPRPQFPVHEDVRKPSGAHPTLDVGFSGLRRPDVSSGVSDPRMGGGSSRSGPWDGPSTLSSQHPLVLNSLGRNTSPNAYKSGRPMMCNFCKNNKEVPDIYLNHYLYDPDTKVLSCPVLRKHVCEICGGTGDQAHTLQYCPVNRERGLQSKVPVLLKTRTITNSTGKIRRN